MYSIKSIWIPQKTTNKKKAGLTADRTSPPSFVAASWDSSQTIGPELKNSDNK
jgi:hypothetical protein